jgi:hypothetical protein
MSDQRSIFIGGKVQNPASEESPHRDADPIKWRKDIVGVIRVKDSVGARNGLPRNSERSFRGKNNEKTG